MSKFKSPTGETQVVTARRTESLDAPYIEALVTEETELLFGHFSVVEIIEKALLAVVLNNEEGEIIGHAAFFDRPNHNAAQPATWESWLQEAYAAERCTALNSLFLHLFVAKEGYAAPAAEEIMRTAFNAVPELHYIFLVVRAGSYPDAALDDLFSQCELNAGSHHPPDCTVFALPRHSLVPVLHIRPAMVEDHDDLTPIFNQQSDILQRTYGEYFLAELIATQDEEMRCLAAEVKGKAVGFMSVTRQVNVELLDRCYELAAFHGLRKPHADDQLLPPRTPTPSAASEEAEAEAEAEVKLADAVAAGSDSLLVDGADAAEEQQQEEKEEQQQEEEEQEEAEEAEEEEEEKEEQEEEEEEEEEEDLFGGGDATPQSVSPDVPPNTAAAKAARHFRPQYHGEANAVVIQLFAIAERHDPRSADFLPHVFRLFPDVDFVIVSTPTLVPEFPLLQQFVRVTPRPSSTLPQELYVFHRGGLAANLRVRPARRDDRQQVAELVANLHLRSCLLRDFDLFLDFKRDPEGEEMLAFVALCMDQLVGVSILRKEADTDAVYLRSHYNIEDFVYYNHHRLDEHARIYHFALNPIFNHYTKLFVKEMMRLADKSCLSYPVYSDSAPEAVRSRYSLPTGLAAFVPVRARRQIQYPLQRLGANAPSQRVLAEQEPFALNHINCKLIHEPKVTINARIVVVGASTTGISFLETLAFCPHLRFNNLLLVSPHGLPGDLEADELRDSMVASDLIFDSRDHGTMSLRTWVTVASGKMTKIDRKRKHILVNGSSKVPYDYLILTTGLQYQPPRPQLCAASQRQQLSLKRLAPHQPRNVFCISDAFDAATALYWLERRIAKGLQGSLVVYGRSLDAYACVQAMLRLGVQPESIVFIYDQDAVSPFANDHIEAEVASALAAGGVVQHSGYVLQQWNDGEAEPRHVDIATFVSQDGSQQQLHIDCCALFAYQRLGVDFDCFSAVNDACLVFDGRLVVDANFHTNDAAVRAAGPLTKFQRAYHANAWSHKDFNSRTVGEKLAHALLRLFDPTLDQDAQPPAEPAKLIPQFGHSPKLQAALLPGGWRYMRAASPGLSDFLHPTVGDEGRHLETRSDSGRYMRLHVSQYGRIDCIECLSPEEFPQKNFVQLYDLHQRLLNNLVSRFDEKLIDDFYDFFNETWALAFYHDRFADFCDELKELLATRPAEDKLSVEEQIRKMMDDEIGLSDNQRSQAKAEYSRNGAKRALETRFLNFVSYNYYHLPMYAKPEMV